MDHYSANIAAVRQDQQLPTPLSDSRYHDIVTVMEGPELLPDGNTKAASELRLGRSGMAKGFPPD